MIGFFFDGGDEQVTDLFKSYLWSDAGIDHYIKKYIKKNCYSQDVELLLVMFYVEGKYLENPNQDGKISNYRASEKSISYSVDVTRDKFHKKTDYERRKFIVDSIVRAVEAISIRMIKKKMNFEKDKLLLDLDEKVFQPYLKS